MLNSTYRYLILQCALLIYSATLVAQDGVITVKYTGSSTIANFIRDAQPAYQLLEFDINTQPESSGGEQAILNYTTDLAGVARMPNPEIAEAGIRSALIGRDIIAVVLNEQNSVSKLSTAQLQGIFTGKVTNWRELGGSDIPIHPYIVGEESATRGVFKAAVLGDDDYAGCKEISPDVNVLLEVKDDLGGIGHISSSFLKSVAFVYVSKYIKLAEVDGEKPVNSNSNYPINRPLYLLSRDSNTDIKAFVDWAESGPGQYVVEQHFIGNGKRSGVNPITSKIDTAGTNEQEGFLNTILQYSQAIPDDLQGNEALMIEIEEDTTASKDKQGFLGKMVRYTISLPREVFEFSKKIPSKIAETVSMKEKDEQAISVEEVEKDESQSANTKDVLVGRKENILANAESEAEVIRQIAKEEAAKILEEAKVSWDDYQRKVKEEEALASERKKNLDSESALREMPANGYEQNKREFLSGQMTLSRERELLELEKMKAKTEEDRQLILKKEQEINSKEKQLLTAYIQSQEQRREIENAEKKIDLQEARMQNQKIVIGASIAVLLLVIGFLIVVFRNFREKKRVNSILELQNEEIATKNSEITDSINYARKIQEAILPMADEAKRLLPDSFVLYKPKDIISGDFYWMSEKDSTVFFATADCTGHGVPGALMSMISISLLNESLTVKGITQPEKILDDVRLGIIKALKQTGEIGEQKDGMDVALCSWNKEDRTMSYAGANSPIYVIRNGGADLVLHNGDKIEAQLRSNGTALYEIKPDRQPVSILLGE